MRWCQLCKPLMLPAAAALLVSCAGQPVSHYARTGDSVVVAIYPSEPNLFVKKEDATVTIVDANQNSYAVRLKRLFRVYSDPTSSYSFRSAKGFGWPAPQPMEASTDPYQGQWVAVVDLVDPVADTAPPLSPGPAALQFSSPTTGDLSIGIEILSGQGQPRSSDLVETLEPMPHVQVTVAGTSPVPIGAGDLTFSYVTADFGNGNTVPRVVATSPDRNVQLISKQKDLGNGTTQINVLIINPHGFKTTNTVGADVAAGMSLLRDLRFSIVWDKSLTNIDDANWQNSLRLVSGQYYDLDGNLVAGLTPVLTKVR